MQAETHQVLTVMRDLVVKADRVLFYVENRDDFFCLFVHMWMFVIFLSFFFCFKEANCGHVIGFLCFLFFPTLLLPVSVLIMCIKLSFQYVYVVCKTFFVLPPHTISWTRCCTAFLLVFVSACSIKKHWNLCMLMPCSLLLSFSLILYRWLYVWAS